MIGVVVILITIQQTEAFTQAIDHVFEISGLMMFIEKLKLLLHQIIKKLDVLSLIVLELLMHQINIVLSHQLSI